MSHRKVILVVPFLLAAVCQRAVQAETLLVPSPDYPTIQSAIGAASNGDEVVVAPGTYNETINFNGKAIAVRSSDGPDATIIDGTGLNDSVVKCVSGEGANTVLDGFTITGGTGDLTTGSPRGGGMYVFQSSPTVMNCTFESNRAWRGGGLSLLHSEGLISGCHLNKNSAEFGGGCYLEDSNSTIQTCTFFENIGDGGGALTSVRGAPTISDCDFQNNQAIETLPVIFGTGGAVLHVFGNPTLIGCLFSGNSAVDGGAVFNRESIVSMSGCQFVRNTSAVGGGAIASELSSLAVQNSVFERNRTGLWGGAIRDVVGRLDVQRSSFTSNSAGEGGGAVGTFYTNADTIRSNAFYMNSAQSQGGALDIRNESDVTM